MFASGVETWYCGPGVRDMFFTVYYFVLFEFFKIMHVLIILKKLMNNYVNKYIYKMYRDIWQHL